MGHAEEAGAENLKGLAKYFNSQTNYGRANVSKATYAVVGVVIAYFYLRPSKKPAQK
ncbi:ATP synthase membrane subunit DAPIT, mitochondrial [Belonocnema kinseyi]|uniref:ATP synthase membrane subunit DAPIT, mitochondrial n=1 Tax=Belonocnema kinseyi TaxID=2817044 RepID=UPI00143D723C|nr:ATP synthase membrane subunit DAPIT, mitochondrial [Belonocnema kinseyi]